VLGEFLGTITKVGPKFGFIECPDLKDLGQPTNVFVLADEMRQYKQGHKVKFTAYLDGKERLQGKSLKSGIKDASSDSSSKGARDGAKQWTTIAEKDTSGGVLGEFLGTITQIGPKFGFIECPQLMQMTPNVFVLADEFRQYKEGHTVRFTAYFDSQGRLQGKDLKSGLKGAENMAMNMPMMMGPQNMGPQNFGRSEQWTTISKKDTSGGELGEFLGTITNIGPKFGFIECPDLENMGQPSKVFILADELRQYKEGHKVKFTAYLDGKGRLQGKDLKSGLK